MNAGAPTGKRNQEQKMQTLRPFGRLGAGRRYRGREPDASRSSKRRGFDFACEVPSLVAVGKLGRGAEALLPPHECGGSHRQEELGAENADPAPVRPAWGRQTLQGPGARCFAFLEASVFLISLVKFLRAPRRVNSGAAVG